MCPFLDLSVPHTGCDASEAYRRANLQDAGGSGGGYGAEGGAAKCPVGQAEISVIGDVERFPRLARFALRFARSIRDPQVPIRDPQVPFRDPQVPRQQFWMTLHHIRCSGLAERNPGKDRTDAKGSTQSS